MVGKKSSTSDDSLSVARCPAGFKVKYCEAQSGDRLTRHNHFWYDFQELLHPPIFLLNSSFHMNFQYFVTGLVNTKSDGVYVEVDNGAACVAVNGAGGPGAVVSSVIYQDFRFP